MFFFFQAEDGIRDVAVTGVQTCALPISRGFSAAMRSRKSTELRPAAGPPAGKAGTRRHDGSDCGHLIVFDAHPGRKRAVCKHRLGLPPRPDEIQRPCAEAQTLDRKSVRL